MSRSTRTVGIPIRWKEGKLYVLEIFAIVIISELYAQSLETTLLWSARTLVCPTTTWAWWTERPKSCTLCKYFKFTFL
jgi:hypothetical protein